MTDSLEIILDIVKMISMILPFLILCRTNRKNNLPPEIRSRQFLMPVIATVLMIAVMFFVDDINQSILKFIKYIPEAIKSLGSVSWMPDIIKGVITQVASYVKSFLNSLSLNFWIFFISNWVILSVYLILKKIAIEILSALFKSENELYHSLYEKVATEFYEYFPQRDKWCIKNSYAQTRNFLKTFYYTAIVISCTIMLLSHYFFEQNLFKAIFYPVFGIVIIGELYFYLCGLTRREYTQDVLGEDENAYKTVNYSLLRKFLRNLFGDKLLSESTNINNTVFDSMTTNDIIYNLEKSEDPKVVSFATFMKAVNETGSGIDNNYLRSSLDLLNGKSILFNNPFYNDHIPYAFYPLNRVLLSHKKVLVVLGRHSIENDIREWIEKGVESVTNIPFMWKIDTLSHEAKDIDIGIITRSDVLDIKLHEANTEFLREVEYCVIIEPSKLVSTAQIGLNLIIKKCRGNSDKNIVFCMFDKNCDGLVDAMSHILMTSISEVSATKKHLGTSSYMSWEADDEYIHHRIVPNIARYLGVGTELSFAGLKNQVSKTTWYGGEAFPVTDINWIDRQYYYDLMRYAGLPASQESMDEHFRTTPNYWSAEIANNNYFTVEDESFNMFEILREFASRSTEQGFINVISPEYLFKDYMADNASIFEADAKAIPYIVADYARTERNVILRLLLMMSTLPVAEETVRKELSLIGIKAFDIKKQLWYEIYKCYADTKAISELSDDYREAVDQAYSKKLDIEGAAKEGFAPDLIICRERYNMSEGKMELVYSVVNPAFISVCASQLKSAGYVAEDEQGEKYYLGSELCGHIYQKYLPGQFFTFGGKYYEMQYLTADGEVLVRRAADHIHGRPAYRQIREYEISGVRPLGKIGASQDIAGMKVVREYADIRVKTPGYYRMNTYKDFAKAKKVIFDENSLIPERIYKNKEILRIELPCANGDLTDEIRYTVATLFNETFKTLFADNQPFISAVTADDFIAGEEECRPLTYSIKGEGVEISRNSIYIIEDSQLDLGLTIAVERNLKRIFEIIDDYLIWNAKAIDESLNPLPDPPPYQPPEKEEGNEDEGKDKKKRKGFFGRVLDKIKGFFKKIFKKRNKKKKKGEPEDVPADSVVTDLPEETEAEAPESPLVYNPNPAEDDISEEDAYYDSETETDEEITDDETEYEPVSENTEQEDVSQSDSPEENVQTEAVAEETADSKTETEESDSENSDDDSLDDGGTFSSDAKIRFNISYTGKYLPEDGEDSADESSDEKDEPVEEQITEEIPEAEESEDVTDAEEQGDALTEGDEVTEAEAEVIESGDEEAESEESEADEIIAEEEKAVKNGPLTFERKKYHERYFLLFGSDKEPSAIDASGTLGYLSSLGFDVSNPLKQARDGKDIASQIEATYDPDKAGSRFCDFCGAELLGVEYETLVDGRDRCMQCGRTAIKSEEEFKKLFADVKRNMESFFGIKIDTGIRVEMVNSKALHKRLGKKFVPTDGADGRTLGVAISDKSGYTLLVENGAPRVACMKTMAHELTHIWQYINWDDSALSEKYTKAEIDELYEGMAKWVEVQYAYLINEPAIAKREEIRTARRDDEYGRGFLKYTAVYPFSTGTVITKPTPFNNIADPLNPNPVKSNSSGKDKNKGKGKGFEPSKEHRISKPKSGKWKIVLLLVLLLVILAIGIKAFALDDAPKDGTDTTSGVSESTTQSVAPNNPLENDWYYYGKLDADGKKIYDAVYNAVMNFQPELTEIPAEYNVDRFGDIFLFIYYDNPQIDWFVIDKSNMLYDKITRNVTSVEFTYNIDKAKAGARNAQADEIANKFVSTVDSKLSDYEKALKVYEYIINLVDYDTLGLNASEKNPDHGKTAPDDLRSIYGSLVNKKSVCAGYGRTVKYLFNKLGMECIYVVGDTKEGDHAWNLVKLDGKYYYMDATWGDASNTDPAKDGSDDINYVYLAMTEKQLLADHKSIDYHELMPEATSTECNYFMNEGLYLEGFDEAKLREVILKSINEGKTYTQIMYADAAACKQANNTFENSKSFTEFNNYIETATGRKIEWAYSMNDEFNVIKVVHKG